MAKNKLDSHWRAGSINASDGTLLAQLALRARLAGASALATAGAAAAAQTRKNL